MNLNGCLIYKTNKSIPLQESENLKLIYVLTEDTIEEASLLRMEMAKQFRQDYIMPLAEFYDLAVNRRKISDFS